MANNVNKIVGWHNLMDKYETQVRRSFQFKDNFLLGADKRIHRFTQKFLQNKKFKMPKEIVHVGVHIRYDCIIYGF